jgi:long-subunit acyl-CoA synthetase (AMP-forming)
VAHFIYLKLTYEYVQDYIDIAVSLLAITTPFALISTHSTRFELVHALKLTKATRLFVDARLLENVLAAIEDPNVHITQDKIYVLSGQPTDGRRSFGQLIDTVERKNVLPEPVRRAQKDTLAYLMMSSGTSGLPKGACEFHIYLRS